MSTFCRHYTKNGKPYGLVARADPFARDTVRDYEAAYDLRVAGDLMAWDVEPHVVIRNGRVISSEPSLHILEQGPAGTVWPELAALYESRAPNDVLLEGLLRTADAGGPEREMALVLLNRSAELVGMTPAQLVEYLRPPPATREGR